MQLRQFSPRTAYTEHVMARGDYGYSFEHGHVDGAAVIAQMHDVCLGRLSAQLARKDRESIDIAQPLA
jgi:hypothetical protein